MLDNGNRYNPHLEELKKQLLSVAKYQDVVGIAGSTVSISKVKKYFRGEVMPESTKKRIELAVQLVIRRKSSGTIPQPIK